MRKLIVAEFITLDGVIQAPGAADEDTEGGFTHGGWTMPYWHDDIGARFFEAISECDALLRRDVPALWARLMPPAHRNLADSNSLEASPGEPT